MLIAEALYWLGRPNTLIWWVAPYFTVAQMAYRRFQKEVPRSLVSKIDRKNACIHMISGSEIWFKSGDNPDSLVGEGIDLLILDEAARVRELVWQQTLRPNLSDPKRLGYCAMASTPTGHNWFFQEWIKGVDTELSREVLYESWAYKELGENIKLPRLVFLQEYGARFLEDLGSVFQNIKGAVVRGLDDYQITPPELGTTYYMGVDLGKTDSFTVITIIDEDGFVVYWDRFRHHSWTFQVSKIIAAARRYNNAGILIDSTGLGDPIYDFIKVEYDNVYPFRITSNSKKEIIENLSIALQSDAISYPNIPELIRELSLFGAGRTAGGRIKYEAPKGWHDDAVISLALAAWQQKTRVTDLGFEWLIL
jgi:hypothetical protein